tara:strand:+ start:23497 stop:24018 length:522 start_codon:yes stop_codon:yes gene_type:complete
MKQSWSEARESMLARVGISREVYSWAIESIDKYENEIQELEDICEDISSQVGSREQASNYLNGLQKNIRKEISSKENSIDDITLGSSNSYKLQVSIPSNLNYLMKAWAAAEGRDLSSVAFQCLEAGLRDMKSKGSIPKSAIQKYDNACEKRIALAELSNTWEKHNELIFNQKV